MVTYLLYYYHLSRIAKIRDSISTTVCKSLIHGLVTSRLDYGNAILYGISDRHMHRLEMVQRSAARIVRQIRRGDRQSMTTILRQLHWLPVRKRIDFKLLVLVHRAIYNGTPEYLAALLSCTGVDRWGTEGDASPHFSAWGDSIGIVPPTFQLRKMAGHIA